MLTVVVTRRATSSLYADRLIDFARSYEGLCVQRFALGLVESTVSPGFVLLSNAFYKKSELATRVGIWYSATGIFSMFSGMCASSRRQLSPELAALTVRTAHRTASVTPTARLQPGSCSTTSPVHGQWRTASSSSSSCPTQSLPPAGSTNERRPSSRNASKTTSKALPTSAFTEISSSKALLIRRYGSSCLWVPASTSQTAASRLLALVSSLHSATRQLRPSCYRVCWLPLVFDLRTERLHSSWRRVHLHRDLPQRLARRSLPQYHDLRPRNLLHTSHGRRHRHLESGLGDQGGADHRLHPHPCLRGSLCAFFDQLHRFTEAYRALHT